MKSLSFRARLAITMGLLILLVLAPVWMYLPYRFEREAIALVAHKAETLAHLTAFTIHPAVYFQDRGALEEALSGTRQDRDVAYVIVTDSAGRRLATFRPERATERSLARRSAGGALSADGSLYEVMTPIRDGGRELARLHVGMSLARLNAELVRMRVGIGVLSAVVLFVGLVAAVLISNVMTRPLRAVAAGARRIAAGELQQPVPADRADEIGQLASSFNDMAERIAERDASLRASHEQLRTLSKRLLAVQEQERVRIAREVHDELGQALTAMKIDLQHIGRQHTSVEEPLAGIGRTIDTVVDLVRRIATDLRPAVLDDLGVTAALEQQLRRLRESTGMKTTLTVSEEPEVDMLTGVTIYRIAQEALANVVRHAQATEVEVSLVIDEGVAALEIRDNGRGISPESIGAQQSLGLIGMRERAELLGGSVVLEGRTGEGTIVKVSLPLVKDDWNRASSLR